MQGKETITPGQLRLLALICRFIDEHGSAPSVRELAALLSVSPNGAHCHLRRLRKKGLVTWNYGSWRTLRPLVRIEVWK